ncbi:hypothetical protein J6590_041980 [Homalodisca vitripennis]|nr:hypothetical protein J6590_041980 [Homalodisca vitripennis]
MDGTVAWTEEPAADTTVKAAQSQGRDLQGEVQSTLSMHDMSHSLMLIADRITTIAELNPPHEFGSNEYD